MINKRVNQPNSFLFGEEKIDSKDISLDEKEKKKKKKKKKMMYVYIHTPVVSVLKIMTLFILV